MTDLIFGIDIKGALASLKRLNKSIGDTAENTSEAFDRSAAASKRARDEFDRFIATGTKASKSLGGSIGGLSSPLATATVGVGALSAAFVTLAAVATKAFIDITEKGIDLNAEAELTRLSLIAIFEGNEGAADAFIDTVGELAIKLGTSRQQLTGLAKGILPDVGSIEGTAQLLENVIILGRDAGQGIESIRIATEEALSGNLSSLGRRLNIPKKTLNSIKEYQKEMSLADAINKGLTERIIESGISAEVTADSFITLRGKIQGFTENLVKLEGIAPFEELKEQARDFLEVLDTQGENIGFVAQAFGDLAANVIDFVGSGLTEFVSSIDFESVERLVDAFNRALVAGQLVIDILFELPDTTDGIQQVTVSLVKTQAQLEEVAKAAAFARDALKASFNIAQLLFAVQGGDLFGALDAISDLGDIASVEGQEEAAKNTAAAFSNYEEKLKSLDEAQQERRDSTEKGTDADIAAGEAVLANKKALDELATAQLEAAKAQDEINKKTADAEAARQKKLTSIIRKEADKRFDDAVKAGQRQEDIARKNADAIEDIFRKNEEAIAESAKDLSQEEQDIARNGARERRDLERNAANERVDIERNFRQELQRIQNQFNQDAADAERNNDAQAFIAAVRSRDEQIGVATQDRDTTVEEAGVDAGRQRAVLAESLAAEVEDANIANAQKLEALQSRLTQELEAQALKLEREIEAEAIKEQRLKEKRDLDLQRQLEDFTRTEAEKTAKLQESLAAQVALVEAAAAKELEITATAEAKKTAIVEAQSARRRQILSAQRSQRENAKRTSTSTGTRSALGGEKEFASGGRPPVGEPVKVGEAGPEIFVPDSAGTIIPNNAIFSPPAQASMLGAGSSSVTNNSPTFNLAESMFQDPVARRQLTNFVLGVLAEGV